ncbi:unnamed protein product [Brachionus calyciflorus]|uniref:Sodium/potassium-transporting ATPase subunit alpha n=1 Tax=Brachionus calyciflorus TaxID=104777 RepID=A0A813N8L2_9BILA|nr:unnamed protein product [Brachionus calyciflorus]
MEPEKREKIPKNRSLSFDLDTINESGMKNIGIRKQSSASDIRKRKRKMSKEEINDLKKEIDVDEHKISMEELCARYQTSLENGLTETQAKVMLEKNGPNALTPPKQTPEIVKFLKQMTSGFSLLLWLGSLFSFIAFIILWSQDKNAPYDSIWLGVALAVVVIITGCFQYYQEAKSGKIMDSFKKMIPQAAVVKRDGQEKTIPAEELVQGDYVFVRIGDRIPADIRIVKSDAFKVDNSSLTGEAEPQARSPEFTHDNPLETKNIAFFSTYAVEGNCQGIVIRTGDNTAMGRIANLASGIDQNETHLAAEIRHFVHIVTFVAFGFGILFFIIMMALGYPIINAIVFLIGVVVSNVPEGLIACVTISLALTAKRMAKKNCLVKHLEAVEALGSVGIICSDKTGTLTMNRMTVAHMWFGNQIIEVRPDNIETSHVVFNRAYEDDFDSPYARKASVAPYDFANSSDWRKLVRCAILCNKAEFKSDEENLAKDVWHRECVGDASESALLQYTEAIYGNVLNFRSANRKLCEVPFNSTNKFQLSIHQTSVTGEKGLLMVMKGAPERILEKCDKILIDNQTLDMTDSWRAAFNKAYETLGGMGERVLGFCDLRLDSTYTPDYPFDSEKLNFPTKNLRFLGFFSLIDPPKPSVPEAIFKCRTAGIKVFMVTGDHPITAKAIAKSVGIINHDTKEDIAKRLNIPVERVNQKDVKACVVSGSQLTEMTDQDLDKVIREHQEIVFARTSPQQKLIIVEACQRTKVLVGVTGDGVNDSPAMKKADIGISMGITGSDVSKQVADMVLLDDNFATIVTGVEEGRLIFDNISKIVSFTFTKNMSELTPFILYVLADVPLALGTITILCVDLGTDILPSLSLAYERPERGIMSRPPRDPVKDKMTNGKMVSFCYGQIGLCEASGGFFGFFVCLAECGFWPSRAVGVRNYWDSMEINDFKDSYGQEWTYEQRKRLERSAQTCFFVGIVLTQMANVIISKTKRVSIFKHGIRNMHMNVAIVATIGLACFLSYTPKLNEALGLYPIYFLWWLPGIPFAIFLFAYVEIKKLACKFLPGSWYDQELNW